MHVVEFYPRSASLLQLSDLAVERVHVLLDDERQFLDLARPIVEERLAARQQGQLLQLCVRVAEKILYCFSTEYD